MKKILLIFTVLNFIIACSKEYNIGKIYIVDETQMGGELNLSDIAEHLIKKTKNIGISNPEGSNSTLKITLSETNTQPDRAKIKNRLGISLTLTAKLKDSGIQIFQSDSTISDSNIQDVHSQIKVLLKDAITKLDYQCTIRKYNEDELLKIFDSKKSLRWQRETIIDELGGRIASGKITDYKKIYRFLFDNFTNNNKEYRDKIIGIFSSVDISRFGLNDEEKSILASKLIKYSIGREVYIQIHTISILSKINNYISRSYIFALSTGSDKKSVRDHAREVFNEIEHRNNLTDNTITSK